MRCFDEAITGGDGLPRVEIGLFGEMKHRKLLLRSVKGDEELVQDYVQRAIAIFKGLFYVECMEYDIRSELTPMLSLLYKIFLYIAH